MQLTLQVLIILYSVNCTQFIQYKYYAVLTHTKDRHKYTTNSTCLILAFIMLVHNPVRCKVHIVVISLLLGF